MKTIEDFKKCVNQGQPVLLIMHGDEATSALRKTFESAAGLLSSEGIPSCILLEALPHDQALESLGIPIGELSTPDGDFNQAVLQRIASLLAQLAAPDYRGPQVMVLFLPEECSPEVLSVCLSSAFKDQVYHLPPETDNTVYDEILTTLYTRSAAPAGFLHATTLHFTVQQALSFYGASPEGLRRMRDQGVDHWQDLLSQYSLASFFVEGWSAIDNASRMGPCNPDSLVDEDSLSDAQSASASDADDEFDDEDSDDEVSDACIDKAFVTFMQNGAASLDWDECLNQAKATLEGGSQAKPVLLVLGETDEEQDDAYSYWEAWRQHQKHYPGLQPPTQSDFDNFLATDNRLDEIDPNLINFIAAQYANQVDGPPLDITEVEPGMESETDRSLQPLEQCSLLGQASSWRWGRPGIIHLRSGYKTLDSSPTQISIGPEPSLVGAFNQIRSEKLRSMVTEHAQTMVAWRGQDESVWQPEVTRYFNSYLENVEFAYRAIEAEEDADDCLQQHRPGGAAYARDLDWVKLVVKAVVDGGVEPDTVLQPLDTLPDDVVGRDSLIKIANAHAEISHVAWVDHLCVEIARWFEMLSETETVGPRVMVMTLPQDAIHAFQAALRETSYERQVCVVSSQAKHGAFFRSTMCDLIQSIQQPSLDQDGERIRTLLEAKGGESNDLFEELLDVQDDPDADQDWHALKALMLLRCSWLMRDVLWAPSDQASVLSERVLEDHGRAHTVRSALVANTFFASTAPQRRSSCGSEVAGNAHLDCQSPGTVIC